jgi:DNA-binding transcriptional regulator of glucitol operon
MRKYLTRRCLGLHLAVVVLVPAFLYLGWWQLGDALGGNSLSWCYVIEWPFFALFAIYMWWRLIHDQRTPMDRLWASKHRAAAEASGKSLNQIPGWALDKSLAKAVAEQSAELNRLMSLPEGERAAQLESEAQKADAARLDEARLLDARSLPVESAVRDEEPDDRIVEANILAERAEVHEGDEELSEYNKYLFLLSRYDES